jgi:hypothetical protein
MDPGAWARLNVRVAVGLRRAWYAGLVVTPILGEQVVAHPGFIPWFMRLDGQTALFPDRDAAVYAEQFRDRARTAASSRLYRSYPHAWRRRSCCDTKFEGQCPPGSDAATVRR